MESTGYVATLATQNVDRLYQKAGHKKVTDLHGRLDQVVCMDCGFLTSRERVQAWLWQHNPQLARMETIQTALRPDGDAEVHEEFVNQMKVPQCLGAVVC